MLIDIYETTVGSIYDLDDIKRELDRAFIEDIIFTSTLLNGEIVTGLLLVVGENPSLKPFNHPISYNNKVITDVRSFTDIDNNSKIGYKVTSTTNFNFMILRSKLLLLAMNVEPSYLANIHPLPAIVYGRFVSETLTYKLGLNHDDQMRLTILATAFYLFQLEEDREDANEQTNVRLMLQVARYTHISPDAVNDTLKNIENIPNVDNFIEILKQKIDNSRMQSLNKGLFFTALTYGWKGVNAKEVMGISLEHPPTWLAVVSSAISERLQKDSPVAKIVKNYSRKGMDTEFITGLSRALESY